MENQTIKLERFKQAVFEDAEKQAKLITESADKQRENELAQAKSTKPRRLKKSRRR